jgi:ribosome-associated protein
MDYAPSRSEKKRQAKDIEELGRELVELPPADLIKLPCDDFLRQEIESCRTMQGGARKRQIKYIARELRQLDPAPLLDFLAARRGSKLKSQLEEKELEQLRLNILDAAITEYQERMEPDEHFYMDKEAFPLLQAASLLPGFDLDGAARAAENFAATRKPAHSKELLRLIRAAAERRKFAPEEK